MLGHYILFNRNCAEALAVYQTALDAKILEMMKYGDAPPNPQFPVPEEDRDLVMHARLSIDGAELMCADSKQRGAPGENMYITLTTADEAYVQKAFAALAQGGTVFMELQPSFFARWHGSLQDKYGVNWMFTVSKG